MHSDDAINAAIELEKAEDAKHKRERLQQDKAMQQRAREGSSGGGGSRYLLNASYV
jgi:hypothetical protein